MAATVLQNKLKNFQKLCPLFWCFRIDPDLTFFFVILFQFVICIWHYNDDGGYNGIGPGLRSQSGPQEKVPHVGSDNMRHGPPNISPVSDRHDVCSNL